MQTLIWHRYAIRREMYVAVIVKSMLATYCWLLLLISKISTSLIFIRQSILYKEFIKEWTTQTMFKKHIKN